MHKHLLRVTAYSWAAIYWCKVKDRQCALRHMCHTCSRQGLCDGGDKARAQIAMVEVCVVAEPQHGSQVDQQLSQQLQQMPPTHIQFELLADAPPL